MSVKIKKSLLLTFFYLFSSAVIAEVKPDNVLVFFLPAQNYKEITSAQEAVPTKLTADGAPKEMKIRDSAKNPDHEKHGIPTKAGVSLYDKGNVPLEQATENIVAPARVLILPFETVAGRKKNALKTKKPESVLPYQVRVFPMSNPVQEIKKAVEKLPAAKGGRSVPPKDMHEERPKRPEDWTKWILRELEKCDMDSQTVLPTLYWLSANRKLTDEKSSCDMKKAVAKHLQKCHPWPVVYYTPVNNDVPVRAPVQMAAEYLETEFERNDCPALNLTGINFERTDFIQGSLKNADFSNSYFHEATFDKIDLSDTLFNRALLDNVLFRDLELLRATFKEARLKYSHFHHVNAVGTDFNAADMQNAQFRDTTLNAAIFSNTVLQNTGWQDVKAYRIFAPQADFTKAGFDNVILNQMSADKANFENISCKDCVIEGASLKKAYFYGASFKDTSFDRTQLSDADFRSAVFGSGVSFQQAVLHKTDFGHVNLDKQTGLPVEILTNVRVDAKTRLPQGMKKDVLEAYDAELDENRLKIEKANRYACSKRTCEDRLLGRVSNQNLAVRAMTILSDPNEKTDNQIWAVCTIRCIAKQDKRLENSQVDILAAFIRHKSPWDPRNDLFKPYTPFPAEAQMALYLLTDPHLERDLGHDIDLSGTDLRTSDLSDGDLRNVNLSETHLGGANLLRSKTSKAYAHFDRAVIDQFTRFPKGMGAFKPFELPDSDTPPWWKPATVRVFRDGTHLWTVTVEDIPFSDDFIARPEGKSEK